MRRTQKLFRYRATVGLATLAGACAVLLLSGGPVLLEIGRGNLVERLPASASLAARYRLPRLRDDEREAEVNLAKRALRETPLLPSAISLLAVSLDDSPDQRLIVIGERMGWRDSFTQRSLYNAALQNESPSRAVPHLIAMMKQGNFELDLEQRMAAGAAIPAFRRAMLPYFASESAWPDRWLSIYGANLDDGALLDLVTARASAGTALDRSVAGDLVRRLLIKNRLVVASQIARWAGIPYKSEGVLMWPQAIAITHPTPFEWHLAQGHVIIQRPAPALVAQGTLPAFYSYRMMNLPEGNYVLKADSSEAERNNWRWDWGCGTDPARATKPLELRNIVNVPVGCRQQWLSLSSMLPQSSTQGLHALRMEPLP